MHAALVKETLEKLDQAEAKKDAQPEEEKKLLDDVQMLSVYSKRLDKNSIYALQTVLPTSQVHTMRHEIGCENGA